MLLGPVNVSACAKCDGVWVNRETFDAICADREQQAAILGGRPLSLTRLILTLEEVRYLPCPDCRTLMNRVNFAGRSGVIVDTCREHGTWFDADELRHIVEFIRSGGVDAARRGEVERLERAQHQHPNAAGLDLGGSSESWPAGWGDYSGWFVLDVLGQIGSALLQIFTR